MRILSVGIILALSGCKKRAQEPVVNTPTVTQPQQQQGLETESQVVAGKPNSLSQTGGNATQSLKGGEGNKASKTAKQTGEATKEASKEKGKKEEVEGGPEDGAEEETEEVGDDATEKIVKKKAVTPRRKVTVSAPGSEDRSSFVRKPLEKNPAFFEALAEEESAFDESEERDVLKPMAATFDMRTGQRGRDDGLERLIRDMQRTSSDLIARKKQWNAVPNRQSPETHRQIQQVLEERKGQDPTITKKSVIAMMTERMDQLIARLDTCIDLTGKLIDNVELSQEELDTVVHVCHQLTRILYSPVEDEDVYTEIDDSAQDEDEEESVSSDSSSLNLDEDDRVLREAERNRNGPWQRRSGRL